MAAWLLGPAFIKTDDRACRANRPPWPVLADNSRWDWWDYLASNPEIILSEVSRWEYVKAGLWALCMTAAIKHL